MDRHAQESHKMTQQKPSVIGWMILMITLLAMSSVGPLEEVLKYPPLLVNFWRRSCSALFFLPFGIQAWVDPEQRAKMLCREARMPTLLSLLGLIILNQCFYISLSYLACPLVNLFARTSPVFLVVGRVAVGQQIQRFEAIGTALAVLGAAVVTLGSMEPEDASNLEANKNFAQGAGYALMAAFGLAIYLASGKRLQHYLTIPNFNFINNVLDAVSSIILQYTLYGSGFGTFSSIPTSRTIGVIFGYLLVPRLFMIQVMDSFIFDVIGMQGMLASLRYFSDLSVSVVLLLQPVVVIPMDLLLRVEFVPNFVTIAGCATVIFGCALVMIFNSSQTTKNPTNSLMNEANEEYYPEKYERVDYNSIQKQAVQPAQNSPDIQYFLQHDNLC